MYVQVVCTRFRKERVMEHILGLVVHGQVWGQEVIRNVITLIAIK